MKKITIGLMVLLAAAVLFSCKSSPSSSAPKIEGEVTQEKVNNALGDIYSKYRSDLVMDGAQIYTVKSGDTLSNITRMYYGSLTGVGTAGAQNGFYFPVIMMASDSPIVDPDLIEPGMELKIIDLARNLNRSSSRKAIKNCLSDVAGIYNSKGRAAEENGLRNLANSL